MAIQLQGPLGKQLVFPQTRRGSEGIQMNGYVARHIRKNRREELIATVEFDQSDINRLMAVWPCSAKYEHPDGVIRECVSGGIQRDCGHSALDLQRFIEELQIILEQQPTRTIKHEEF